MNFGNVYNPSTETATVVLEVAFNTDPTTAPGDYGGAAIECTIGGTAVADIPTFAVVENVSFLYE